MKKITLVMLMLLSVTVFSQSDRINYKALIKDANNAVIANTQVTVQFTILQGVSQTNVYQETHTPTTDANGIIILNIGDGTVNSGVYADIDWASDDHFLNTQIDSGSGLTDMGTTGFNAVPYALSAKTAENIIELDPKVASANANALPKWDGNSLVDGAISDVDGNIGIGTALPDATLHLIGDLKYEDGNQATSKILTSDAQGNATWQSLKADTVLGTGNAPSPDFSCLATVGVLGIVNYFRLAVVGNYVYVVGFGENLEIIDISNPASPVLVGTLGIGSLPYSLAVVGNYAYVVDLDSSDLKVIDISNPTSPSLSGTLGLGSAPYSLAVAGNYAYVVDLDSDDLQVIDISNPTSPLLVGNLGIGTIPVSLAILGNYAYVVDQGSDDLKVIDISNPTSPVLAGTLGIGSSPNSVAVAGNYAYVVDEGSDDLKVIDISNPTSPLLVGNLGIGTIPVSLAILGNYAYVVDDGSDDLKVIDISNPTNPMLSVSLGIGSGPRSVAVLGNYAYVVDVSSDDLKVIQLSCGEVSLDFAVNPLTGLFTAQPALWNKDAVTGNIFNSSASNVGIGTASPNVKLQITGGVDADLTDDSGYLVLGDITGQNMVFDDNEIIARNNGAQSPMYLQSDGGNVSIGAIIPPTQKLDVQGNIRANGSVYVTNRVGIGTTAPSQPLDVVGNAEINGIAIVAGNLQVDGNSLFVNANTNRVGIGTSAPSQALDVVGNAEINGNAIVSGDVEASGQLYGRRAAYSGYYNFAVPLIEVQPAWFLVFFDIVDPFNLFSGLTEFRAPRTGLYFFSTSVTFSGGDGSDDTMEMGFSVDGSTTMLSEITINPRALTSPGVEQAYSHTMILSLTQGQTVGVLVKGISSTSPVIITDRTFTGFYLGDL